MPRPLIGVDLDGVIALEDYEAYIKAKAEGISALRNYYKTLKPNTAFVAELQRNAHKYRYRIYTARKDDLPDIKDITIQWLQQNNIYDLFYGVVFTGNAWKWPWLIKDRVVAHIDNDYSNLKWCPFMYRLMYNHFVRHTWFYDNIQPPWKDVHEPLGTWAADIFDFLNEVCYTK
jgi:hypothetical protein